MDCYHYHIQPHTLDGDLITPMEAYLKVRDRFAQSALMESSDYHTAENNRSFIGLQPLAQIAVGHGQITMTFPDGHTEMQPVTGKDSVPDALAAFTARFDVKGDGAQYCGLYGYMGFSAVQYFEDVHPTDSVAPRADAPDILYILYKYVLVWGDCKDELVMLELLADGETSAADDLIRTISRGDCAIYDFHATGPVTSPLTDEEHKANIRRGIAHCKRGDVFQIVLSRRFVQRFEGDDFRLYRALRRINPSPYLFYFDFGSFRIFGSSPETHCRLVGDQAYIDPIAGTTRRVGTPEGDAAAAAALLADPKENAEHVMLVDLARNDLSRNCTDVKVEFFKETQYYSHVIHLVSRVNGRLRPGTNPFRLLGETFPAGTLSGAPKVKALELILRYEPHDRGAYGGCIGFIGLDGSFNQAITIRSFVSRAGELWFQAGGGIVAASNEEYELQEVNNKLGALRKAILEAEHVSQ